MNRLLTDRQCMASLVCWLAAVALWLIFSPGVTHLVDVIANGVAAHG